MALTERQIALLQAALHPLVFRELYEKGFYGRPRSEIEDYLMAVKGFTMSGAITCAENFQSSLAFALEGD